MNLDNLGALIEPMLCKARVPGAAMAIVADGKTVFARGFGYRDLVSRRLMSEDTLYPIASTVKAVNATLLGSLVDEGKLAWDEPVQRYLPRFYLQERYVGALVTLRDLLAMRTGLPGHDFVYFENPITRSQLVERMGHLPLSTGFRERFQYNDLTVTIAGHIAEIVTGQSWDRLVKQRIFEPLGMSRTDSGPPLQDNITSYYHENSRRETLPTRTFDAEPIGPAGGSTYSTVSDMARWVAFNLGDGSAAGRCLIQHATLRELHTPCVIMGDDAAAPSAHAAYGLGWFVDTYNGHRRVSNTGWLHDVNSCVTLFPDHGIGMVSFINFASSRLSSLLNQQAFDVIMGLVPAETLEDRLAQYEEKIERVHARINAVRRVPDTSPSHSLKDYAGVYEHLGYGAIEISTQGGELAFRRGQLTLPLEHWHYDSWVIAENDLFEIHKEHFFVRSNRLVFETGPDGQIAAFSMSLEPTVAPIRFSKRY